MLAVIPYRTFPAIELGPVELNTFGLMVGLGVLIGRAVAWRALRDTDVDLEAMDRVLFRALLAGFVGARLAWVMFHLGQVDNLVDVIAVWNGGLQFSGGFLAGIASAWPWVRRQTPQHRRLIADAASLGMALGLAIGRIGCIAVGEHLGGPTRFFLATRYDGGRVLEGPLTEGVAYHNTAVYEMLHLLVLFAVLMVATRRGWFRIGDGRTSALFFGWYALGRFTTDLTRTADSAVLGLTGAQWVSLLVLLPLSVLLWRGSAAHRRTDREDLNASGA